MLAELDFGLALRHNKRAFWESLATWIALVVLAALSKQMFAAISALGWLAFVFLHYLPRAARRVVKTREVLRARIGFLNQEDVSALVTTLPPGSIALRIINANQSRT